CASYDGYYDWYFDVW
nr:immunoglobulin heavy chain junction region [Mus musculus]MBK4188791.1 immunoglobulin heavy chain junction region [Mus musculus]MBK4188792.1 immunoglobulin heavy chain junction region [Mus musculus]MBK4188793.1 immunoglobulin heavy chain junction region [Mus musculus]MBK4188794.1 immunoglobulin heavy chain junction region [Mus musculus]